MKVKKKPVTKPQDNDNLSDMEAGDLAWKTHKRLYESVIVELFQVCIQILRVTFNLL